jgi:tripartite-type tricarboxylate transporter receptor subunit TctC
MMHSPFVHGFAHIERGIMSTVFLRTLAAFSILAIFAMATVQQEAIAQGPGAGLNWPAKPIRWVVPFAPGGPTDIISRLLGPKVTDRLGQPVIVENRAGAGGNIGTAAVTKAPPDGYTVLFTVPTITTNPFFFKASPDYRDLAPVIQLSKGSYVLLTSNGFPAKSVPELLAAIKAKPGTVSCGTAGGLGTVACELLRSRAQADMIMVNYKGQGPALAAVVSGEIAVLFEPLATGVAAAKQNRVRAVATLDPKRGGTQLPTVAETIADFDIVSWHGVMAPNGTPREILQQLNRALVSVLGLPDVRQRHVEFGLEVVGSSVEEFEAVLRRESAMYEAILKNAGVKPSE